MVICEIWLFGLFFLNTTSLICRSTDISKCFKGFLRFRDNEGQLYFKSVYFCLFEVQVSVSEVKTINGAVSLRFST